MQKNQAHYLFQSIWGSKAMDWGIFEVSNTQMNLCNHMVEQKERVKKQKSKKGFETNEHACILEGASSC